MVRGIACAWEFKRASGSRLNSVRSKDKAAKCARPDPGAESFHKELQGRESFGGNGRMPDLRLPRVATS